MNTKATVTLFLGSGFLTGWIAQCLVAGEEQGGGQKRGSGDATGREMREGEITSGSAKGTVIFSPKSSSTKQPGSLPLMLL